MDLRQSTSGQVATIGHALDSTDGNTEENALAIANTDIKLHKHNTTTLANKNAGGATNISNGVYHLTLDATDTAVAGRLVIYVHVAGGLAMKAEFNILTISAFDAKYTGIFNNLGGVAQTADNDTKISLIPTTDNTSAIAGIPTVSEFNARTLPASSYFDPATDTVANVTLCATTTTNTDMRGTNSALLAASYTAPDNASITLVLADTNELQLNQNNWLTATGFSTFNSITDEVQADINKINGVVITGNGAGSPFDVQ